MPGQTVCYFLLVLVLSGVFVLSCLAFLSQAVRTDPDGTWIRNFNALIIGASYVIVVRLPVRSYHTSYLKMCSY